MICSPIFISVRHRVNEVLNEINYRWGEQCLGGEIGEGGRIPNFKQKSDKFSKLVLYKSWLQKLKEHLPMHPRNYLHHMLNL